MILKDSETAERFNAALAALRARRAKVAERVEQIVCEIERFPTTIARQRLAHVVALVDALDAKIGHRGGALP
jgi:hypothetical protein